MGGWCLLRGLSQLWFTLGIGRVREIKSISEVLARLIRKGKSAADAYGLGEFVNDPLPALEGRGFTLGVSVVTPPITGLLNSLVELCFINPSLNSHVVGRPRHE